MPIVRNRVTDITGAESTVVSEVSIASTPVPGDMLLTPPKNRTELQTLTDQLSQRILSLGPIDSEPKAQIAAQLGSALRRVKRFVSQLLDPGITERFEAHRKATADKKALLSPLNELESSLSAALAEYQSAQKRALEAANQSRIDSIRYNVELDLVQEATTLLSQGETEQATQLVASMPSTLDQVLLSLPENKQSLPTLSGSSTTQKFTYTLNDLSQVRMDVIMEAIQTTQGRAALDSVIKRRVKEQGKAAEHTVGGITVEPETKVSFRA